MTGEVRTYMVAPGIYFRTIHELDELTYPGPNRYFLYFYNIKLKKWIAIGNAPTPQMAFKIFCALACVPYRDLEESRGIDYLNYEPQCAVDTEAVEIKVTCYGKVKMFNDREKAINYFSLGKSFCEVNSSEWRRYDHIVLQLERGATEVTDDEC